MMRLLLKRFVKWPEHVRGPTRPQNAARVVRCKYCGEAAVLELLGADYKLPRGWRMIWEGLRPTFVCQQCSDRRFAEIMKTLKGEKS